MAADRLLRGLRLVWPAQPTPEPRARRRKLKTSAEKREKPEPAVAAAKPEAKDLLRFEDTPAFRRVVRLSLGPAGRPADELGKWVCSWMCWWQLELLQLEYDSWPKSSEIRSCLWAAGCELRFIAELLAVREQEHACRQVLALVDTISQAIGEEIPQATRGAFRDTVLLHVTEPEAREALETISLLLWEWAVNQEAFCTHVVPGAKADLHVLADYLDNLIRLPAFFLDQGDRGLANLPRELAREVSQLAASLDESRKDEP